MATGSEVQLAMAAQKELHEQGHNVSVVSMPSLELFELQSDEYKQSVLPKDIIKRVAIEMGSPFGWDRYVGFEGKTVTLNRFGASGKGEEVMEHLGFTVENVVKSYLNFQREYN